jgi:hypothetical protein
MIQIWTNGQTYEILAKKAGELYGNGKNKVFPNLETPKHVHVEHDAYINRSRQRPK